MLLTVASQVVLRWRREEEEEVEEEDAGCSMAAAALGAGCEVTLPRNYR